MTWRTLLAAAAVAGINGATAQSADLLVPDTALVILTGSSETADLRFNLTGGVSHYTVTLRFDDTNLQVTSVDTVSGFGTALPAPAITPGPGFVTISTTGPGSTNFTVTAARLRFALAAGAATGALVSYTVDSLLTGAGTDALAASGVSTRPLRICRATRVYGDVDVSLGVTSRDALITLTASVGLPTVGFEMQWADVDRDGITSSRDALFQLSEAVGMFHSSVAGDNVASECDPISPAPSDVTFFDGSTGALLRIAAGDTNAVVVPTTTASFDVSERPTWAPDGSRIAYEYFSQIYAVDASGTNPDTLTTTGAVNWAPSWSPDGTQIAFVSSRTGGQAIWVMDVDGANPLQVSPDTFFINDVQWAANGTRLFFSAYNAGSPVARRRVWAINPDGSGLARLETGDNLTSIDRLTASPAADSVVYSDGSSLYAMALADTSGVRYTNRIPASLDPTWIPAGVLFVADPYVFRNVFFERASDGRLLRLTRKPANLFRPTIRHPGLRYVNTVTIAPTSLTLAIGAGSQTLTATVNDSDASVNTAVPVTWISRDPTVATVTPAQPPARTAQVNPVATGGPIYVVATVRGWRADSVLVTVN